MISRKGSCDLKQYIKDIDTKEEYVIYLATDIFVVHANDFMCG